MAVADLAPPRSSQELRARYRAFMEEHVYPNEPALARRGRRADRAGELQARAKAEGLWAPHVPPEAGGTGQGFLAYAHLNEEIGRASWAQLVFGCQAPDAGNAEILHLFGTPEQKERWLRATRRGRGALVLLHDRAGGARGRIRRRCARARCATATSG